MRGRILALMLVATMSMGVAQFSPAAQWFADLQLRRDLMNYTATSEAVPDAAKMAQVTAAREYNQALLANRISLTDESTDVEYLSLLRREDTATIATVTIPEIGVALPVMHGTGDEVLNLGAGHYYGSSLPVGGPGSHTAISAHSGLVTKEFFTRLPELTVGSEFTISSFAGDLHYAVVDIRKVPAEAALDQIVIEAGRDLATLITCVPIGINSHRLLVTGERLPDNAASEAEQMLSFFRFPGLPWWAAWIIGALLSSGLFGKFVLIPKWRRQDRAARRQRELAKLRRQKAARRRAVIGTTIPGVSGSVA
jgi:sortase A